MAEEIIFLVEESPEGGYTGRALGYSIYTEGESLEELKTAVMDAIRCHFKDNELPKIVRFHVVKDEVVAL